MVKNTTNIIIYKPKGGAPSLEVQLTEDTVWLTQSQIAALFQSSRVNITEHIQHIFEEGEIVQEATSRKFRQVRREGNRKVTRYIEHYNLDLILSVGYRVKSNIATQFRIWATRILKDYTVKGYALNEKRLRETRVRLEELTNSIGLIRSVTNTRELIDGEAEGLLKVITDYAYGLHTLDEFDRRTLTVQDTKEEIRFTLNYPTARKSIDEMSEQLKQSGQEPGLFGREKDDSLKGSLENIYQSVDGKDAYPSIEEKAAHLLYFIIKNHPFVDGNKRIAASFFLWFLDRNECLYRADGTKRIADNALVALTLMVAESSPTEKELIVKVIVNLINQRN